jgi:hypothetical protein
MSYLQSEVGTPALHVWPLKCCCEYLVGACNQAQRCVWTCIFHTGGEFFLSFPTLASSAMSSNLTRSIKWFSVLTRAMVGKAKAREGAGEPQAARPLRIHH